MKLERFLFAFALVLGLVVSVSFVFALDASSLSTTLTSKGVPLVIGNVSGTLSDFSVSSVPKVPQIGDKSLSAFGDLEVIDYSVGLSSGVITLKVPFFDASVFGVAVVGVPNKGVLPVSDLGVNYGLWESWSESEPVFGWVADKPVIVVLNDKNGDVCPKDSNVLSATTCEVTTQTWKQTGTQLVSKSGIVWDKKQEDVIGQTVYVRVSGSWSAVLGDRAVDVLIKYGDWRKEFAWWNSNYTYRRQLTVTNNSATTLVDNNYAFRFPVSAASLSSKQTDCDDVRMVYDFASVLTEIDRNVLNLCNADFNVAVNIQANILASATDSNYWLYYGNGAAVAPTVDENILIWNDGNTTAWVDFDNGLANSSFHAIRGSPTFTSTDLNAYSDGAFAVYYGAPAIIAYDLNNLAMNAGTIEFWMKLDSAIGSPVTFFYQSPSTDNLGFQISGGNTYFPVGGLTWNAGSGIGVTLGTQIGEWHYWRLTFGPLGRYIFEDNNLMAFDVTKTQALPAINAYLQLGGVAEYSWNNAAFTIDRFKITSGTQLNYPSVPMPQKDVNHTSILPTVSVGAEKTDINFVAGFTHYFELPLNASSAVLDVNDASLVDGTAITSWSWNDNNVQFATTQNATKTFTTGGDHNISLIISDGINVSQADEIISVFGKLKVRFFDENMGSSLVPTTLTLNGLDLLSYLSGNALSYSLAGVSSQSYDLVFSDSNHASRTLSWDLNSWSSIDVNALMLGTTKGQSLNFVFANSTKVFGNDYIKVWKNNSSVNNNLVGYTKTNSLGVAALFLNTSDLNYSFRVYDSTGTFDYNGVGVQVLVPKDEANLVLLDANTWALTIQRIGAQSFTNITGNLNVVILPFTQTNYVFKVDYNGAYYSRDYAVQALTGTSQVLQPYLTQITSATGVTISVYDAFSRSSLPNIKVVVQKNLSGLGLTTITSGYTGIDGKLVVYLVSGGYYDNIAFYSNETQLTQEGALQVSSNAISAFLNVTVSSFPVSGSSVVLFSLSPMDGNQLVLDASGMQHFLGSIVSPSALSYVSVLVYACEALDYNLSGAASGLTASYAFDLNFLDTPSYCFVRVQVSATNQGGVFTATTSHNIVTAGNYNYTLLGSVKSIGADLGLLGQIIIAVFGTLLILLLIATNLGVGGDAMLFLGLIIMGFFAVIFWLDNPLMLLVYGIMFAGSTFLWLRGRV